MTISSGQTITQSDLNGLFGDQLSEMAASAEDGRRPHYINVDAFSVASTTELHKRSKTFRPNDDMEIMAIHVYDWGHGSATSRTIKATLEEADGGTKYLLDDDMSVSNTDATTGQTSSVLDLTDVAAAKKNWVLKGVLYRLKVEVVTTSFTHGHISAHLALKVRQRR